jgi:hypothetical protein
MMCESTISAVGSEAEWLRCVLLYIASGQKIGNVLIEME